MQSWEDRKNAPRYYTKFPEVTEKLVAQTVKHLPAMRETWVRFLGREDPLEKEMAIHSSTLAWKSHGRRNLIGYSSWGCKESNTTERLQFQFNFNTSYDA